MLPRTLSAFFGGLIIIGAIIFHKWSYFVIFVGISCLTLLEFHTLMKTKNDRLSILFAIIIGFLLFSLSFLIESEQIDSKWYYVFFPLSFIIFFIKLYKKEEKQPIIGIGIFYFGIFYISLPFALINMLVFVQGKYIFDILLGTLFLIWINDIGAYFVGILLGRKKLFHRISPKKSWEGSIGGAIITCIMSLVIANYFKWLTHGQWMVIACIVVIFGTYGDLIESHFKRSLRIKDSGSTIPGHGGFLDRFDSILLVIPFVVVVIKFF